MATPSLVTSIAVAGANTPLTVTPSSGTGAVTITSNIPTYTSSQGITRFTEATSPVNYDFRGTYENIAGGAGISFGESGGLYVIDADVASVNTVGRGITTTTDSQTGEVTVNAAIASLSGPTPGIIIQGPDGAGNVVLTPNICDINPGNGISISRANPRAPVISALVADIQPGAGVGVSKNLTSGTFTVSANVVDVTSNLASGILTTTSAGNVKSTALNIALPTNTGLQQATNPGGQYTLFTNYNNLLNGVGTTVSRVSGITPTASITANVASLNPTSKGITTANSGDGQNIWTITNTGILGVDSASPAINVTTDPTSGIATLTFIPSETLADEQVLEGSLQVPILVGGRIQGSHFNGYSTYLGNAITCIQPSSTSSGPGDCLISAGANVFSVSNGVITGSGLQSVPQISSFTYLTANQQAPNVPTTPGTPFNTDVYFFTYYEAQAQRISSNYTGYQVAAFKLDGGNVQPYFSLYSNNYTMVPAQGVAVNPANMYALIAGPTGLWIGQPFPGGLVNMATLLQSGSYSNPVVTRLYNRANASDMANMLRARCFCTQENGGLCEVTMTTGAPFFSAPVPVPGSPTSVGWLPLKVVPLQDQWVNSSSTAPFDYLIYMSNSIITSIYNTSTQTWSNIPQPGYVGAFYNLLVTSVANPNDTIYSEYFGGGLITSDLPPLASGAFPTWSSSSQTASVFFPPPLDYNDVITFGSTEGLLYQSTFTPDITEIVANTLQVKALDSIAVICDGDMGIGSTSLEVTNTAMTLTSGDVDLYTDSLAVHTGSIDMDSGTAINMASGTTINTDTIIASSITSSAISTGDLTATGGVLDFASGSVVLPTSNCMRGTLFPLPLMQSFYTNFLSTYGVVSNVLSTITIAFPVSFPAAPNNTYTVQLTPYCTFNGFTLTYNVNSIGSAGCNVTLLFSPGPNSVSPSQVVFSVLVIGKTA